MLGARDDHPRHIVPIPPRRSRMKKLLIALAAISAIVVQVRAKPGGVGSARFTVIEATIPDIQKALQTRLLSTEELVQIYLNRIQTYDPASRRATDSEGRVFFGLNS